MVPFPAFSTSKKGWLGGGKVESDRGEATT
jgi:hypothetical protein